MWGQGFVHPCGHGGAQHLTQGQTPCRCSVNVQWTVQSNTSTVVKCPFYPLQWLLHKLRNIFILKFRHFSQHCYLGTRLLNKTQIMGLAGAAGREARRQNGSFILLSHAPLLRNLKSPTSHSNCIVGVAFPLSTSQQNVDKPEPVLRASSWVTEAQPIFPSDFFFIYLFFLNQTDRRPKAALENYSLIRRASDGITHKQIKFTFFTNPLFSKKI